MIALWLILGCVNERIALLETQIAGEIAADAEGPITVSFEHAWTFDEGAPSHPLGPIEAIALDGPGPFAHTLIYPLDEGEGLVVYAWQDRDGDGALCAPGADDEPAGLVEVAEFPAFSVEVDLTLDQLCAGPERLFP